MKLRFFDFEVFPEWWCLVTGDYSNNIDEQIKDTFTVISSDDERAREKVIGQLKEPEVCCVGYNIKKYDLIIANGIYQGFPPHFIKILNDIVINPSLAYIDSEHMRMQPFIKRKLSGVVYQDLMDDNVKSLKEKECALGLSILESSVPFDKVNLTDEDKKDIIYYCKHDVWSTMVFYNKVAVAYVDTKLAIGKTFNIPEATCYTNTNATLCGKALKAQNTSFSDAMFTHIDLPLKIYDYCVSNLPGRILTKLQNDTKGFTTDLFNNKVSFGNGGIHSVYTTDLYVESDKEYTLINVDASSYYPNMLIQFDVLSRAVEDPQVFKDIVGERMTLKHKLNRTKEEEARMAAYKLVANTTYGASGNEYLALYDPYNCSKCCRLGQIFLASLACKISNKITSAKIIQTNTDGILVYIKRTDIVKLQQFINEWTTISGIEMETAYAKRIWQKDVNNYILETEDGKLKNKGGWLRTIIFNKGTVRLSPPDAFICAKAAIVWFMEGTSPAETILKCTNLSDFVIACMKGPTYSKVIQRYSDGREIELYKSNRVIATKNEELGKLYKIKKYKDKLSYTMMSDTPDHCLIVNDDLSTYNFNDIRKQLDYGYYLVRTLDLINRDWQQLIGNNVLNIDKFQFEL